MATVKCPLLFWWLPPDSSKHSQSVISSDIHFRITRFHGGLRWHHLGPIYWGLHCSRRGLDIIIGAVAIRQRRSECNWSPEAEEAVFSRVDISSISKWSTVHCDHYPCSLSLVAIRSLYLVSLFGNMAKVQRGFWVEVATAFWESCSEVTLTHR